MDKSVEAVQCFVDGCPAALLEKTSDGILPLHFAVGSDFAMLPVLWCLLRGGPRASQEKDNNGLLPLHRPAEGSARLIDVFPEALVESDNNGWQPLHFPAKNENASLELLGCLADSRPEALLERRHDGSVWFGCTMRSCTRECRMLDSSWKSAHKRFLLRIARDGSRCTLPPRAGPSRRFSFYWTSARTPPR
jgi:ankyrin repeat protein